MKVAEFIGIIVLECERCGKKFVADSEAVKAGFQVKCCWDTTYPDLKVVGQGSTLKITIEKNPYGNAKELEKNNNAMPISEYKKLLADFIITGKKPKIKREHSKVVSIETDESQYQSLYESLRQLGFKKDEAFAKIDVALKEGLRMETEIIKYILSLK